MAFFPVCHSWECSLTIDPTPSRMYIKCTIAIAAPLRILSPFSRILILPFLLVVIVCVRVYQPPFLLCPFLLLLPLSSLSLPFSYSSAGTLCVIKWCTSVRARGPGLRQRSSYTRIWPV